MPIISAIANRIRRWYACHEPDNIISRDPIIPHVFYSTCRYCGARITNWMDDDGWVKLDKRKDTHHVR